MAPTQPDMNSAVMFNNHGVDFLLVGNFVEALQMFQGALKVVSQTISEEQIGSDPTVEQARSKLRKRPRSTSASFPTPKETNHFLYTKGVYNTPEQMNNRSLLSSTIMFNMALAHHMRSFESPSLRTQSQERALKLYSLVFEAGFSENSDKDGVFDKRVKIVLASLNNIAQIQHEFGDYDNSRQFLDELYRLATCLPDSTYEDFKEDRSEFVLNASLLTSPSRAAAA